MIYIHAVSHVYQCEQKKWVIQGYLIFLRQTPDMRQRLKMLSDELSGNQLSLSTLSCRAEIELEAEGSIVTAVLIRPPPISYTRRDGRVDCC